MKKINFYKTATILLLISNLVLLSFMYFQHNDHRGGPRDLIIQRLHFDKKQVDVYDDLIHAHRKAMKLQDDKIKNLKNNLYTLLIQDHQEKTADSVMNLIAAEQNLIEHINYNHFIEIKKLCKPEQLPDYNKLTADIAGLFGPPHRPNERREEK